MLLTRARIASMAVPTMRKGIDSNQRIGQKIKTPTNIVRRTLSIAPTAFAIHWLCGIGASTVTVTRLAAISCPSVGDCRRFPLLIHQNEPYCPVWPCVGAAAAETRGGNVPSTERTMVPYEILEVTVADAIAA